MSLKEFLAKKPLFYKEIDHTRMPNAWNSIKEHFSLPKIIHIVGTNGKGSTGRFLAYYLYKSGFKTGHYTSPHILSFNERIWINGQNISDELLEENHKKLLSILDPIFQESLSYFEYTTLLAILSMKECEYIVLEAGLGGEHDATAVFDNILTLSTVIDYDHKEFLGTEIKDIAKTKLNAAKKSLIIGQQQYLEVYCTAEEIKFEKNIEVYLYNHFLTNDELILFSEFIIKEKLPSFLYKNLTLALSAVKFLGYNVDLDRLKGISFFGRCQKLTDNVTIDVGHNPLAAKVLYEHFRGKKVVLIYNSFKDKEFSLILKILKPIIKRVEFIPVENQRVAKKEDIIKVLEDLSLEFSDFRKIDNNEEYLVFGSFLVVEAFLKAFNEK